jgi:hypothetical protein
MLLRQDLLVVSVKAACVMSFVRGNNEDGQGHQTVQISCLPIHGPANCSIGHQILVGYFVTCRSTAAPENVDRTCIVLVWLRLEAESRSHCPASIVAVASAEHCSGAGH